MNNRDSIQLSTTVAILAMTLIVLNLFGALLVCAFDYALGFYTHGEFLGVSKLLGYFEVWVFIVVTLGLCASHYSKLHPH